jgi:hypothetical protein
MGGREVLTGEVRVNGALIGFLYIVNKGTLDGKGTALYSVEYYEPGTRKVRSCSITHIPHEGALVLLKKAISGVLKEEKDGSKGCH